MTKRIYIDRSRYETAQKCQRARWYEYHQDGVGIASMRKPLPLAVGGSVHVGLEVLLRAMIGDEIPTLPEAWRKLEDGAVKAALLDFSRHENAIDVDTGELVSRASLPADAPVLNDMDAYLYREQSALVEAQVRAYARRRLRPLVEQFEILEVEREGEWMVWETDWGPTDANRNATHQEGWFMSRPDALLRERESNQLYLQSFKTAASWDVRKARDAEHDMQGLSEGIEIERRLAEWWAIFMDADANGSKVKYGVNDGMYNYLRSLDAPPRILGIRYEYLLKGDRKHDKDLSAQFGVDMRSQKSPLVRYYEAVSTPQRGNAGYSLGDRCWAWDFIREDGRDSSLAWQNWKSRPAWELPGGIRAWIDELDSAAPLMSEGDSTLGIEPHSIGWHTTAQALGTTREHPLDTVFIPPVIVYRNEDDLRDLIDQMEAQERRIAEGVAAVNAATDEGERRHQLNVHFVQSRHACEYPSTCSYARICYGGDDIRRAPLASGLYRIREANHPQEMSHG